MSSAGLIEEVREAEKIVKYKKAQQVINVDGDTSRTKQVFVFGFFGRLTESAYKYIRELSKSKANCSSVYHHVLFSVYPYSTDR